MVLISVFPTLGHLRRQGLCSHWFLPILGDPKMARVLLSLSAPHCGVMEPFPHLGT